MRKDEIRLRKALGSRIRLLRQSSQLTQQGLADRAKLDRSYIAAIESGLRNPSLKSMARMAHGLGTTLARLFETVAVQRVCRIRRR